MFWKKKKKEHEIIINFVGGSSFTFPYPDSLELMNDQFDYIWDCIQKKGSFDIRTIDDEKSVFINYEHVTWVRKIIDK